MQLFVLFVTFFGTFGTVRPCFHFLNLFELSCWENVHMTAQSKDCHIGKFSIWRSHLFFWLFSFLKEMYYQYTYELRPLCNFSKKFLFVATSSMDSAVFVATLPAYPSFFVAYALGCWQHNSHLCKVSWMTVRGADWQIYLWFVFLVFFILNRKCSYEYNTICIRKNNIFSKIRKNAFFLKNCMHTVNKLENKYDTTF